MHRLVFRPLLILLALTALVIASLQVGGRLFFLLLDDLQVAANQYLWDRGIQLEGLEGDWHLLNPVVRIERIKLPAGYVSGINVEVDLLESLWRSALITHSFILAEGDIGFEQTPAGWRLRGAMAPLDLDLEEIVYHSDSVAITTRLNFVSAAGSGELDLSYESRNRSGFHRHRLQLHNPDQLCETDCDLRLEFDGLDAVALVRTAAQSFTARSQGFVLPRAIARFGEPHLDLLDAYWRRDGETAGGVLNTKFSGIELAPGQPIAGSMVVKTRGTGDSLVAQISELQFSRDVEQLTLPDFWLEQQQDTFSYWTPELDLGALLGFLGRALPEGSAGSRWLGGLQVEGQARNLRGFYNRLNGDLGYAATLQQVNLESFGGAPYLRDGGGELVGFQAGMQIALNAERMDTHWRGQFADNWLMEHAQGILQAWFGADYFAMRGLGMRLSVADSNAAGGFALSRVIGQPQEDRLTLIVNVDEATVPAFKRFRPQNLPQGLLDWVEIGPQAGILRDIAFAYHGQIVVAPFELARRVELSAYIKDGRVQYHPDWPILRELDGRIEVMGRNLRLQVDHGVSAGGARLDGSRLELYDNAAYADINLSAATTVEQTLAFVRATPLKDYLSFVGEDWDGTGVMSLDGNLHIPLNQRVEHIGQPPPASEFAANLDVGLSGASLQLPEYRIELEDLSGMLTYTYPNNLRGANVRGNLFGAPAVFAAHSDEDTVVFDIAGQADVLDVLQLLDAEDPGVARGGFDFLANVYIELGKDISRIDVVSDLTGLTLDLPGEFSKQPEDAVATSMTVRFLEDYQAINFDHGSASGWLQVAEKPLRGAIGFGESAPLFNSTAEELLLSGRISGFSLDEVVPDDDASGSLLLPLRLTDFHTDFIDVGTLRFADVAINGHVAADDLGLVFESDTLQGEVSAQGDEPLQIHLSRLHLPTSDASGEDPLDPSLAAELPRADVTVDQFSVGDEDYGSWAFKLIPDEKGVAMAELEAQFRGVAVSSEKGVYWNTKRNESRFKGTLRAGDLKDVLPLWDIAPSLTTTHAELTGDLRWSGSPANVDIDRLVGPATIVTGEGRFLEMDTGGQGALKLFSLVNFSTVLKRLNFDFSDVQGEGITFDKIRADTHFDKGVVTFTPEPMEITGSGSEFKIAGQINLVEGTLDNEMIVTLPVTRSLPWYAAYIALANPLTAIGVLVGERVLRKPFEQISSAKYLITGPIDSPQMHFVSVWDRSIDKPTVVEEPEPEEVPTESDTPVANAPREDS